MNRSCSLVWAAIALAGLCGCRSSHAERMQAKSSHAYRISVDTYVDKMKAGWIGQMAGVGWGVPTEFKYKGVIMPEDQMPPWEPQLVNQFQQDDLYVEMTFLRSLELLRSRCLHPAGRHRFCQQRVSAVARQPCRAG